ncbi:competence protein ComEA [Micromonospora sp. M71_S20]|uniref:ComEA family DNA-binding protein n=1 Tax=Micromonospora sp. M71_S20 TaxID=592872 RepID=UPI000EADC8C4|nr:ComEA family DNA-binding protein [Micromonospora sp. M71_S20]RLK11897.1 competence protein ComEA [Micromonospora sp. M71_S20]
MSDDEETVVRERLRRLVAGRPSTAPRTHPGGSAGPVGWSDEPVGPSVDDPGLVGVSEPVPSSPRAPSSSLAGAAEPPEPDPPARAPEAGVAPRLPGPGAFDPGRRGVRALAAVAVVVVLVAGFWAWRSRPQAEPVRPVATAGASDAAVTGLAEPAATPAGELVVAVAGKVRRPGLVRVPAGARVADAVEAAGGALPGVDVALLNPARKVTDGELILVGVAAPPGAAPPPGAAAGGAPGAPGAGGRLNLNTATLAQLDALPGVGPVLAQRILAHRDQQGGFRSVGDLRQVDGIGDARYEQLKDLVTV